MSPGINPARNWYHWEGDTLILSVSVQTRASRDEIGEPEGDYVKVRITAAPVEGKANKHLIRFLGNQFNVAPSHIRLLAGDAGRRKRLAIASPTTLVPGITRPKSADMP